MAAPAVDIYSGSWDTGYRCDRQEVDLDGRWRIVLKDDDTATTTLNAFIEGTGAPRVVGSRKVRSAAQGPERDLRHQLVADPVRAGGSRPDRHHQQLRLRPRSRGRGPAAADPRRNRGL